MGLPHSGGVAEAALVTASENELMSTLPEHKIDFYCRFKDDILIIFNDAAKLHTFINKLRGGGHPFSIGCEEISSHRIQFLEVLISHAQTHFEVRPQYKKSKLNVPILSSTSSCHHKNVHASWPVAQMTARLGLCSSRHLQIEDLRSFIARAIAQHASSFAISKLLYCL